MDSFFIQPIVDLPTGRLCGGEVLWRPDGVPPTVDHLRALEEDPVLNLRIAEESFVFALNQLDRLQSNVWLSVNLSTRFIGSGRAFYRALSKSLPDLDALRRKVGKRLVVEVTEEAIAGQAESAFVNDLATLHHIAVDDFGVGDAPLSHMLSMQFTKVKVDRSVVSGVDADVFRQRFLRWLVSGCHSIGVEVCAEGVETESELAFLRRLGVNQGQGWYWSKALPMADFEALALPLDSAGRSLGQALPVVAA
jgi:EAL domain-containing protein (putative c-di-GMP-specific phosphodiesterase class I)